MMDKKIGEEALDLAFIFLSTIFLLRSSGGRSWMTWDRDKLLRQRGSLDDSAEIFAGRADFQTVERASPMKIGKKMVGRKMKARDGDPAHHLPAIHLLTILFSFPRVAAEHSEAALGDSWFLMKHAG